MSHTSHTAHGSRTSHRTRRPALLAATCVTAVGLGLGLAAVPVAAAGQSGSGSEAGSGSGTTGRQYDAKEVHHFLKGFYGNHGPSAWEREHLVTEELKEKAAQTPEYDLLLCAQNTPEAIDIGPVTTAQSAGVGWAPVTTHWGKGQDTQVFTAYVGLDASKPMKLMDISCEAPNG
ncbi:hypothetical protein H8N01_24435 [Streptomyces sp. AC536]|uniref:hypothetical protein n=1 Tax=Streptomyces buecherae TaxID=2763006 RepID=UPI00164ED39C|nr:hypothetical protein [Streptomyces buecherae]MBC3985637.1 hypothetical protein [Streptomyces buecherae]QNJ42402.1 hypothetical protein H7H31_23710 [Streptomyces buecherae]